MLLRLCVVVVQTMAGTGDEMSKEVWGEGLEGGFQSQCGLKWGQGREWLQLGSSLTNMLAKFTYVEGYMGAGKRS